MAGSKRPWFATSEVSSGNFRHSCASRAAFISGSVQVFEIDSRGRSTVQQCYGWRSFGRLGRTRIPRDTSFNQRDDLGVAISSREVEGGVAVGVLEGRVGAAVHQQPDDLDLTLGRSGHERGETLEHAPCVDLGAGVEQQLHGVHKRPAGRIKQRSSAVPVFVVDLGALDEEVTDDVPMTVEGGIHHRRSILGILDINGDSSRDETFDLGEVAGIGGLEEGEGGRGERRLLGRDRGGQDHESQGQNGQSHLTTIPGRWTNRC